MTYLQSPPTVVGRAAFDGYVRTKNTMPATDGDTIIFWELVPDNGADVHPAVLVIPGSGNQGARDLIGEPSSVSRYYYQSQLAVHLARAGYAAYVPELRGYGERAVYTEACDDASVFGWRNIAIVCHEMFLRNQLAKVGIGIDDYRVDDLTRILRHMTTLGHIDRENIAVAGLSLGGGYSQEISAYNPDVIRATVVASGTGSHFHGPPSDQAKGNGQFLCCDTNEFTATIAPRPLYVSFGSDERSLFRWEAETGHTAEFLGRVYSMLGAEGNLTYVVHEGRHEYHVPSVIEFLDRHLRPA